VTELMNTSRFKKGCLLRFGHATDTPGESQLQAGLRIQKPSIADRIRKVSHRPKGGRRGDQLDCSPGMNHCPGNGGKAAMAAKLPDHCGLRHEPRLKPSAHPSSSPRPRR
jgi:hypothetical protein